MRLCPCCSDRAYDSCCGPILSGEREALTAEAVMRARYSAYATGEVAFITNSLHPDSLKTNDEAATRRWAEESDWLGLQIVSTEKGGEGDDEGVVEFIATYREKGERHEHHEISRFTRHNGRWLYMDGDMAKGETVVRESPKVGRNEPCPCGSGKKYKKCCGANR